MKPILILLCTAGLAGCQAGGGPKSDSVASCHGVEAVGTLADDAFRSTLWQQSAAEYDALSLQVFARAEAMLERALADPDWDALHPGERQGAATGQTIAIISDIDETLLDNSAFSVRLMREPMPVCMTVAEARADWDRRWLEWVSDVEATAMPGAAEFMQRAAARSNDVQKVEIFYVTNRKDNEKVQTCENLIKAKFPLRDCQTQVLTRNDLDGRAKDKVSRRSAIAAKHRVALIFGDNLGDFVGNIQTSESERNEIVADREKWWGERWFMLPNPSYGSWEEILGVIRDRADDFDSAAERNAYVRAQKERRLEDCRKRDCLK